jgi:NADH-quinone oxidoreductase subunit N
MVGQLMNWQIALPEIVLAGCGLLVLMIGVLIKKQNSALLCSMLVLASFLGAALLLLSAPQDVGYNGLFTLDRFAVFVKILVLIAASLAVVLSLDYNTHHGIARFEFPVLILLSTVGMMVMVSATNMMSLYLGVELSSLAIYVLAAFARNDVRSSEAGLKYFVLGALASGLLLYGMSLVYGFAGSLDFASLRTVFTTETAQLGAVVGVVFIVAGLAFKISAAPFHMWTPDVYEGAPVPVTSFMATAPKVAALAVFVRILSMPFGHLLPQWQQLIVLLSIVSMVWGSLAAIGQWNIKRLMAYSSIGHMGYALVGVATGTEAGVRGVLVYLASYIFASAGVFACIISMRKKGHAVERIADLKGLGKTDPMLAFLLMFFMFSLAGVPPFAGFIGKLYVFLAAVQAGMWTLAIIGVLTSVISTFYYLWVLKQVYFDQSEGEFDARAPSVSFVAGLGGLVTLAFFVFASPVVNAAEAAAKALFG